jgi:hypothetical protein
MHVYYIFFGIQSLKYLFFSSFYLRRLNLISNDQLWKQSITIFHWMIFFSIIYQINLYLCWRIDDRIFLFSMKFKHNWWCSKESLIFNYYDVQSMTMKACDFSYMWRDISFFRKVTHNTSLLLLLSLLWMGIDRVRYCRYLNDKCLNGSDGTDKPSYRRQNI